MSILGVRTSYQSPSPFAAFRFMYLVANLAFLIKFAARRSLNTLFLTVTKSEGETFRMYSHETFNCSDLQSHKRISIRPKEEGEIIT